MSKDIFLSSISRNDERLELISDLCDLITITNLAGDFDSEGRVVGTGVIRTEIPDNLIIKAREDGKYTGVSFEYSLGNYSGSVIVWLPVVDSYGSFVKGDFINSVFRCHQVTDFLEKVYEQAAEAIISAGENKSTEAGSLATIQLGLSKWCVKVFEEHLADDGSINREEEHVYCAGDTLPGYLENILIAEAGDVLDYLRRQAGFIEKYKKILESAGEGSSKSGAIIHTVVVYCYGGKCESERKMRMRRSLTAGAVINDYLRRIVKTGKWIVQPLNKSVNSVTVRFVNWEYGGKVVEFYLNEYLELYVYADSDNPSKIYAGATRGAENNVATVPKNIITKLATQYKLDKDKFRMMLRIGSNVYEFLIGRHKPLRNVSRDREGIFGLYDFLREHLYTELEYGYKSLVRFLKSLPSYVAGDWRKECVLKCVFCKAWQEFYDTHKNDLPNEIDGDSISWADANGFCRNVKEDCTECLAHNIDINVESGEPTVIIEYDGEIIPAVLIARYLSANPDRLRDVLSAVCAAFTKSFSSMELSLWNVIKTVYSSVGLRYVSPDYLEILKRIPRWFESVPDAPCRWQDVASSFLDKVQTLVRRTEVYYQEAKELFSTSFKMYPGSTGVSSELTKVESSKPTSRGRILGRNKGSVLGWL